jgi:hypothetical protein
MWGSRNIQFRSLTLTLDVCKSQLHTAVPLSLGLKKKSVEKETVSTPELFWTYCRREKSLQQGIKPWILHPIA